MNASDANGSSSFTLWSVNHPDGEVRCVVDLLGSGATVRGSARMVVDGVTAEFRRFADAHDLASLTTDWQLRLNAAPGGWR
jgi:hypothetical protein